MQRDALIGWEAAQRGELVDGKPQWTKFALTFTLNTVVHLRHDKGISPYTTYDRGSEIDR